MTSARLVPALAVVAGLVAMAGCAAKAPSAGVARVDRAVVVAFKPCDGDREDAGLGRIDIFGSDDPERSVWSAVHIDGQPATLDIPIVDQYPGYDIKDRRPDDELDEDQTYSVEAVALDGTEWGGPGFRVGDLRAGKIRVAGQYLDFAEWVDEPASCPNVTFVGALLTGLVVAALAGGTLVAARGIRRAVRGGRRAPSPDA
jgi:hypothetical protein